MHTVPGIAAYLKENLGAGSVVGIDPTVHPAKFVKALAKALAGKHIRVRPLGASVQDLHPYHSLHLSPFSLLPLLNPPSSCSTYYPHHIAQTKGPDDINPVDEAWAAHGARPPAPQALVRVHPLAYAGEAVASKVARLGAEMGKEGADVLVAGTLDEVAWLLNVRGDDVPNCPLAVAYAVLERQQGDAGAGAAAARAVMFVEEGKLGAEARRHLVDDCGVEVRACVLPSRCCLFARSLARSLEGWRRLEISNTRVSSIHT